MYLIESQVAQSSVCIDCYILRVKFNAFSITIYGFLVVVLWEIRCKVRYYGQKLSYAAELFSKIQAHHFGANFSFQSTKRLGVFLLPSPGWDASPSPDYPYSIKFAGTLFYTWVERGTNNGEGCCIKRVYHIFSIKHRTLIKRRPQINVWSKLPAILFKRLWRLIGVAAFVWGPTTSKRRYSPHLCNMLVRNAAFIIINVQRKSAWHNITVTTFVQQTVYGSYADAAITDKLSFWLYSARFPTKVLTRESWTDH